ncbi:MAG: hypothetical protein JW902_06645 [Syntrophaceae bacterium]|nr:hypothetical protein [Syntrophaceae bacterium]
MNKEKREPEFFPVYYPKEINEDILISEEPSELSTPDGNIQGTCKIVLKCLPRASFRFYIDADIGNVPFPIGDPLENIKTLFLPERNLDVPGFSIEFNASSGFENKATITWALKAEPFIAAGNGETLLSEVIFHIFNFTDFINFNRFYRETNEKGGWTRINYIKLVWQDWEIEIRSLPQTSKINKDLKSSGGCGLTHVGFLRKLDKSSFEAKHAENILMGLRFMLSFTSGTWCSPVLPVGYNEKGEKVWEMWTSPAQYISPQTWFDRHNAQQLENLFPGFMDKWVDDTWHRAIKESIYWYLRACDSYNGIDAGIILIQAAIERLSCEYAVNQKKLLTIYGFKDLWASDKFRLLFSSIDIPLEIPAALESIKIAAKKQSCNWLDSPHAFTEIRNSIVHPEHKNRDDVKALYYEAWSMGLWYLELAILRLCNYEGNYSNRLTSKRVGEVENVPWQKA